MGEARAPRIAGAWPSPLSPRLLAGTLRLGEVCWDSDGRTLAWLEGRGDVGVAVVQPAAGGPPRDLTPDRSVRARVGYGGGDIALAHGTLYFVGAEDQRLYARPLAGGLGGPITPPFGEAASPAVSPDGRWVVFVHSFEGVDALLVVPADGSQLPIRLAAGRDFYMQPVWHPSGRMLAWIEWDQPNMPWDGTELRLAEVELDGGFPRLTSERTIAGGPEVAVFQPAFSADGKHLLFVSDEPGWGHLFAYDLERGERRQLTSGEAEFGRPAWMQGMRSFAPLPDGRVAAVRQEHGFESLVVVDVGSGTEVQLAAEYTSFSHPVASPSEPEVACVASAGRIPPRVVVFDLRDSRAAPSVRRYADAELVPQEQLSEPQPVSWRVGNDEAHGLLFPPVPQPATAPPLLVSVHGGPTSHVSATWRPYAQYFATRGWAVLEVNYRGSTGYGRAYMLKGREAWGVVDVEDCAAAVEELGRRGLAAPRRAVIMGGSAGGYTVLQSLVTYPGRYRAGVCMFGVSNLFSLASDTHKFEARYLDRIVGPLPEAADRYRERSPLFHADRIVDPLILFHGDQDRVVPLDQSERIVASLRARGVPHEFHVYQGEGHGWRRLETIEHFLRTTERFLREHVVFA